MIIVSTMCNESLFFYSKIFIEVGIFKHKLTIEIIIRAFLNFIPSFYRINYIIVTLHLNIFLMITVTTMCNERLFFYSKIFIEVGIFTHNLKIEIII